MFFKKRKNKVDEDDDDMDLDEFDFDELDDFDDFDGEPRKPSNKQLAKTVAKTAAKEAGSKMYKQTAKDLIPGDFESNLYEVKDFANQTKTLIQDSTKEITNSLSRVLPKSLADKLGISKDAADAKRATEQEAREAGIQNTLDSIFNKQAAIEKKMDESKEVKREVAIESSKMAISKMQTDVMGGMSNDISRLSGFFLDIGSEYFKKSLELQYKSYYLQMDLLKTSSTYFKGFSEQFDKIVKNTGLPEHVKITQMERLDAKLKDALTEKVYATAFTNNAFVQNVKNNLENKIKGLTSDIKSSIENIGGIFEMSGEAGGKANILARMGGSWLGNKISSKVMDKFSPKLKEQLGDNDDLQALGHFMDNLVKGTSTQAERAKDYIRRAQTAAEDTEGFKGTMSRGVWKVLGSALDLTNYQRRDLRFKENTMADLNSPAIFDNHVYRSVTDAIPMFLGRILQQNTNLTNMFMAANYSAINASGMYKPADLLVYNYMTRGLTTISSYRDSVSKWLGKKDKAEGFKNASRTAVNSVVDELSKDKKGNKKAIRLLNRKSSKELLEQYMTTVGSKEDIKGDTDILFKDALSENAHSDVKKFLEENPQMKEIIEAMSTGLESGGLGMKSRIKHDFHIASEDSGNDYPVGSINELYVEASRLSGLSEVHNSLSNTEASEVGYAMASYISNSNKDIIPTMEVLTEVFSNFPADVSEKTIEKTKDFINDVNIIMNGDSRSKKEQLVKFFVLVNQAIRLTTHLGSKGEDRVKSMFETIRNANPDLMGEQKTLTVENMFNRTVGEVKVKDKISADIVADMFDGKRTQEARDIIGNNRLTQGLETMAKEAKDAYNSGDTVKEKFQNLAKHVTDKATENMKKSYDKLSKKTEELSKKVNDLTKKAIDKGLEGIIKYVYELNKEIDGVIKDEVEGYKTTRAELEKALSNIAQNTDVDTKELEKKLSELADRHEKRLAGYKVLQDSLQDVIKELNQILESDGVRGKVVDSVKKVREILISKIDTLKGLLDRLKKEDI